jgi:hypothetical protein
MSTGVEEKKDPPAGPAMPSDKSVGDAAVAIAKAGLQSVPLIGGAAAELLANVVTAPLERRRLEWLQQLGERLSRLEADGRLKVEDLREDEAFADVVLQASQVALRTSQREKREALRNAVINSALQLSPEESERQMFLQMIDRFTVWHLRLLKAFDNPPTWAKTNGVSYRPAMTSSLSGFLEAAFPELRNRRDLYDQVWSELGVAGLHATGGLHTMMTETGWLASRTTETGKRFLRFIEDPSPAPLTAS